MSPGIDIDRAYAQAARILKRSPSDLQMLGFGVFAAILHHCLCAPKHAEIWTLARIKDGKLDVEVDIPPRRSARLGPLSAHAVAGYPRTCVHCGATWFRGCNWIFTIEHRKTNTGVCDRCDRQYLNALVEAINESETPIVLTHLGKRIEIEPAEPPIIIGHCRCITDDV